MSATAAATDAPEMVLVPYDDFFAAYRFVPRSRMFPNDCLKTRLRSLLASEDVAHADEAEALADRQAREEARDGGRWEQARAEERAKCVADIDYVIANIIPTPTHRVRFSQRDLEKYSEPAVVSQETASPGPTKVSGRRHRLPPLSPPRWKEIGDERSR